MIIVGLKITPRNHSNFDKSVFFLVGIENLIDMETITRFS